MTLVTIFQLSKANYLEGGRELTPAERVIRAISSIYYLGGFKCKISNGGQVEIS